MSYFSLKAGFLRVKNVSNNFHYVYTSRGNNVFSSHTTLSYATVTVLAQYIRKDFSNPVLGKHSPISFILFFIHDSYTLINILDADFCAYTYLSLFCNGQNFF